MPILKKMLLSYDLDLLGRIGSFWGVDTMDLDLEKSAMAIANATQDQTLFAEILESLPFEAKKAWQYLTANNGKVTWAQFIRKFGEVREFGRAKREREAPDRNPSSIAEILWYRGLVGRAFLNIPPEPREFAFVPDEFIRSSSGDPLVEVNMPSPILEDRVENRRSGVCPLPDRLTDWLAARRKQANLPDQIWQVWPENDVFFKTIARADKLVDKNGEPDPNALAGFFNQDRESLLLDWLAIWVESQEYNDLRDLPGLVFEGEWRNDPLKPRRVLLDLLKRFAPATWYSISDLVNFIKITQPDFQRPSGDYDSWFIRRKDTNEYLRGFKHWDEIDGALIRYLITGPLYWLGMTALGTEHASKEACFCFTPLLHAHFTQTHEYPRSMEKTEIEISTDLVFTIPIVTKRAIRYQVARFSELRSADAWATKYEITPASIRLAQKHGLEVVQLVQYLEKQTGKSLPKALVRLGETWGKSGQCTQVEHLYLLRTPQPEILAAMKENPQTGKFIKEILSPTAAIINPAGVKIIKKSLLEQGQLTEVINGLDS